MVTPKRKPKAVESPWLQKLVLCGVIGAILIIFATVDDDETLDALCFGTLIVSFIFFISIGWI